MKIALIIFLAGIASCSHTEMAQPEHHVLDWSKELQDQEPRVPFLKIYEQEEKKVYYVASAYATDPEGPTQQLIKKEMSSLKPEILIIEGVDTEHGLNPIQVTDSMKRNSPKLEQNIFSAGLAIKMGIPFIGGEVSTLRVKKTFKSHKLFTDRDLVSFLLLRGLITTQVGHSSFSLKEAMRRSYAEFNRKYELSAEEVVGEKEFLDWYRRWTGKNFDSAKLSYLEVAPLCKEGALRSQLISCEIEKIKNRHVVSLIQKELKDYNSVMVIYGASSQVSQDHALKAFLPAATYLK